jgi:hypothetical protein
MFQAAYPHSIDQGFNGTCNVTTVEKRIFVRNPSEAARLIADVAETGRYVTRDGIEIDMSRVPGALSPDKESRTALAKTFSTDESDVKIDNRRTYASQIFETTAVNIRWANSSRYQGKAGDVVLYEKPFEPMGNSTGERLFWYHVSPVGQLERTELDNSPNLWEWELTNIHNQITGGDDKQFVIYGPGRGADDKTGTAIQVRDAEELELHLLSLRNQQSFPAILTVHTGKPPFLDINDPNAGGNGGWHVINIQNIYRDADGKTYVEFTNQWGAKTHHMSTKAVEIDVLFEATKERGK